MRAVALGAERPTLAVTTVADPEPGPGEVVLSVTGCGICGSDLHLSGVAPAGTVLGHEVAGRVEGHGPGLDPARLPVGTLVAPRPLLGCGRCAFCRRGRPDHCAEFQMVGLQRPGGFAEAVAVAANECFVLPAEVAPADHALVEPFAVARRAARRGGLGPGSTVAVLGAGPIGLTVAAWARALGASGVAVSDPAPDRRQLALDLGADHAFDPGAGPLGPLLGEALGGPPDVVVEAAGRPGLIDQALGLVGVEGRVVVVGICLEPDSVFPWTGLAKEADVAFSIFYGPEDYTDTIDAFADGRLRPGAMVTGEVGLDELPGRFAQLLSSPSGGKVVVRP
jgi:(R,R)-butanediol dehydrogenase/meso-butanediol dehydrogenase/diacetyl reductase